MSTFAVTIHKIKIEEHPNADALELAVVGEFRAIVAKGVYTDGDLVAYVPEGAIVPEWLIVRLNLEGRLAGRDKNRVKAIRLRGVVSQGLIVPTVESGATQTVFIKNSHSSFSVRVGDDVTDFLGITKWEPPIPVHMAGEVQNLHGHTMSYDIENYKRYPDVLQDGEDVVITEKLHGTWAEWGWHPQHGLIVSSKGLSSQGLCFKNNDANTDNLYMKTLMATMDNDGRTVAERAYIELSAHGLPIYILGEIFGGRVQDLKYGLASPQFRMFDVYVGEPGRGRYFNFDELKSAASVLELELVPVLYRGPFSRQKLLDLTDGKETVSGTESNIREGVVVRSTNERMTETLGRVQLKSVSNDYLLRKGNTTEFQ